MRKLVLTFASGFLLPYTGHAAVQEIAFRATLTTEFFNFSDVTSQDLIPLRAGDLVIGSLFYDDTVVGNVSGNRRSINYNNPITDSAFTVFRSGSQVATFSQRAVFFANGNRSDESQINVLNNDPVGRRDALTITVGGGDLDSGSVVDFVPGAADIWRTGWSIDLREPCSSGSLATGNCLSNDPNLDLFAGVAKPSDLLRAIELGGTRDFSIVFLYRNGDVGQLTGVVNSIAQVPEPATWSLLLLGFGLCGATLRRRRAAPG